MPYWLHKWVCNSVLLAQRLLPPFISKFSGKKRLALVIASGSHGISIPRQKMHQEGFQPIESTELSLGFPSRKNSFFKSLFRLIGWLPNQLKFPPPFLQTDNKNQNAGCKRLERSNLIICSVLSLKHFGSLLEASLEKVMDLNTEVRTHLSTLMSISCLRKSRLGLKS